MWRIVLLFPFALALATAQTTITQHFVPLGTKPIYTHLAISWPRYVDARDQLHEADSMIAVVPADGNLSLQLAPSERTDPSFRYSVRYYLQDGQLGKAAQWSVPASDEPLSINSIELSESVVSENIVVARFDHGECSALNVNVPSRDVNVDAPRVRAAVLGSFQTDENDMVHLPRALGLRNAEAHVDWWASGGERLQPSLAIKAETESMTAAFDKPERGRYLIDLGDVFPKLSVSYPGVSFASVAKAQHRLESANMIVAAYDARGHLIDSGLRVTIDPATLEVTAAMDQPRIAKLVIIGAAGMLAVNTPPPSGAAQACYLSLASRIETGPAASEQVRSSLPISNDAGLATASVPTRSESSTPAIGLSSLQTLSASLTTASAGTASAPSGNGIVKSNNSTFSIAVPDVDYESVTRLNVKSYGAKCDGSTDDTAAIRSALSAAQSRQIPTVVIPQGTCVISAAAGVALKLDGTVSLQGAGSSDRPLSQLKFVSGSTAGSAALALAAGVQVSHIVVSNLSLIAGNANPNSVGIYMGGDPNSQITNAADIASFETLEHVYVRGFGTNVKYGNNAYGNSYFDVNLDGALQFNMDTQTVGLSNTGITERVYGGLWGNAGIAGIRNYNANWKFFGTHFEFNCTGVLLAYGSISMFGPHFEQVGETCGPAIEAPWGNAHLYINGGEITYNDSNSAANYGELIKIDGDQTNVIIENAELFTNGAQINNVLTNSSANTGIVRIQPMSLVHIRNLISSTNPSSKPSLLSTSGMSVQGQTTFAGNVQLSPAGSRPSCSSETEGVLWYSKGSNTTNGSLQLCQNQSGTFAWVSH